MSTRSDKIAYICAALVFGAISTVLAGCQSVAYISTDPPGSTVYLNDKQLGLTPVELNSSAGAKVAGGYLAEIRRSGYDRVWVWVPVGLLGLDINLNLKPFASAGVEGRKQVKNSASRIVINKLTAQMLNLQQRMLDEDSSKPEVASALQKELADLLDSYPEVGSLHFLKAIEELKENKTDFAKSSLARAMGFSPKEYDFLSLYNLVGGSPPSNESKTSGGGSSEQKK